MAERKVSVLNGSCYLTVDEDINYQAAIIAPIISSGDTFGAVILATKDAEVQMGFTEMKIAETAAGFLAKHMEI